MSYSPELIETVKTLDKTQQNLAAKSAEALSELGKSARQLHELQDSMGFFDKYLFGIFGNQNKINERNRLEKEVTYRSRVALDCAQEQDDFHRTADNKLDTVLRKLDATYNKLATTGDVQTQARAFENLIEDAREAVLAAQKLGKTELSEEAMRKPPKATPADIEASKAVRTARKMLSAVKSTATSFQADMHKNAGIFADAPELSSLMSRFNAARLAVPLAEGPAEFDLLSLRAGVHEIAEESKKAEPQATLVARHYRDRVRAACLTA